MVEVLFFFVVVGIMIWAFDGYDVTTEVKKDPFRNYQNNIDDFQQRGTMLKDSGSEFLD